MYWQKRFNRVAPDKELEERILSIRKEITTDTSEFKYYEIDSKGRMIIKKLYLDPFLDIFNGEIISYNISKTPSAVSVLSVQKKAIEVTSDCPYRRVPLGPRMGLPDARIH